MALVPPDTKALLAYMRETDWDPPEQEVWASEALQAATDLMYVATGLTALPADEAHARIVTRGIMEMAFAIMVYDDGREAIYSPFTSERIGSYSYQKATDALSADEETGVRPFDFAVNLITGEDPDKTTAWTSSEAVFERQDNWPNIKTKDEYDDATRFPGILG